MFRVVGSESDVCCGVVLGRRNDGSGLLGALPLGRGAPSGGLGRMTHREGVAVGGHGLPQIWTIHDTSRREMSISRVV